MKIHMLIVLFVCAFSIPKLQAQPKTGEYSDHFGAYLNLKADSTFKYTFDSHRAHIWSAGKWHIKNKKLTLKVVLVYDTLQYDGKEELILSADEIPEKIIANNYALSNQKSEVHPDTFIVKKKKLLPVVDGKIVRNKRRSIITNKKLTQSFIRKS